MTGLAMIGRVEPLLCAGNRSSSSTGLQVPTPCAVSAIPRFPVRSLSSISASKTQKMLSASHAASHRYPFAVIYRLLFPERYPCAGLERLWKACFGWSTIRLPIETTDPDASVSDVYLPVDVSLGDAVRSCGQRLHLCVRRPEPEASDRRRSSNLVATHPADSLWSWLVQLPISQAIINSSLDSPAGSS